MSTYIVLDTETTGREEQDRICQLAFIVMQGKAAAQCFDELIKPPLEICYEAMAVHHITNEMLINAPKFADAKTTAKLNELNHKDNILIIHNAAFDMKMLAKEGFQWQGKIIDSLKCIKHLEPDLDFHNLQYLRYRLDLYKTEAKVLKDLGLDKLSAHDALSDVVVLKQLMTHLIGLIDRDIDRLLTLSQSPVMLKKINFGKHKGKALASLVNEDRNYLEWLYKQQDLDEDLKYTLGQLLL